MLWASRFLKTYKNHSDIVTTLGDCTYKISQFYIFCLGFYILFWMQFLVLERQAVLWKCHSFAFRNEQLRKIWSPKIRMIPYSDKPNESHALRKNNLLLKSAYWSRRGKKENILNLEFIFQFFWDLLLNMTFNMQIVFSCMSFPKTASSLQVFVLNQEFIHLIAKPGESETSSSLIQFRLNKFFVSPVPLCINVTYEKQDLNYSETWRKQFQQLSDLLFRFFWKIS